MRIVGSRGILASFRRAIGNDIALFGSRHGPALDRDAGRDRPYIIHLMRPVLALVLGIYLFAHPVLPAAAPMPGLAPGGSARVVEAIDGDTVVLDDGREVRLVGIQAPKLPLGRDGFDAWPLAAEAKRALEGLVLGRRVELGFGGRRSDRHGRSLAHLYLPDGTWVQGEMVRRGLARAYTFADNRALAAELLAAERTARHARRGIWANSWYRILAPDEAEDHIDSFQLVEGRILDAAVARGTGYLNFGPDHGTDFTAVIPKEALALFLEEGHSPQSYEGHRVRVRGWVQSLNGAMIEVTHPEQIEEIDE